MKTRIVDRPATATGRGDEAFEAWAQRALVAGAAEERSLAYALEADKAMTGLRAVVGQLSGILILAQARIWRGVADLPELAVARERRGEALEQIERLDPPEARRADRDRLREALARVDGALGIVAAMREARTDEGIADAARHLKAAYRLMQSVCDHRIGLTMIDTSDACCKCGKALR